MSDNVAEVAGVLPLDTGHGASGCQLSIQTATNGKMHPVARSVPVCDGLQTTPPLYSPPTYCRGINTYLSPFSLSADHTQTYDYAVTHEGR